jgi:histone deacetylase 11
MLEAAGVVRSAALVPAVEATLGMLRSVHSADYLARLEASPMKVAQVTELAPLAALPAFLLRRKVLKPMRYMAGGSVQAGALALERGWAVNLGGGMHHAHYSDGGGWCAYDDITLLISTLRSASEGRVQRVMIVDLDVHQGNGHERSKLRAADPHTFTVDVYNADIYPRDTAAKAAIDVDVPLRSGTSDEEYLAAVAAAVHTAFERCAPPPDLLVYNAGTDVLGGDPLGLLRVSERAVVERDAAVFAAALARRVPVVMLLSGGYTAASTPAIAASVANLVRRFGPAGGGRE